MITVRFSFYVEIDAPAGTDCEQREFDVEFDTTDQDHALELAERWLEWNPLPARTIPGTLRLN